MRSMSRLCQKTATPYTSANSVNFNQIRVNNQGTITRKVTLKDNFTISSAFGRKRTYKLWFKKRSRPAIKTNVTFP